MTTGDHGVDGVERRGLMFVLSSPSGAGKTTLSRLLIDRMPGLKMSVSATTRPMRPGEVDGRDYLFVGKHQFETMAARADRGYRPSVPLAPSRSDRPMPMNRTPRNRTRAPAVSRTLPTLPSAPLEDLSDAFA